MKRNLLFSLIFVYLLIFLVYPVSISASPVWIAHNKWSLDWEIKFAKFTETLYDYYRKGGGASKYFPMRRNGRGEVGVYLDCTNLLYASRAIFSYENSLPFMTNLSGYNKKKRCFFDYGEMGNFSNNFSGSPGSLRKFKSFLRALLNVSFSCTLNDDTFPIAVRPDVIMPGMVYSINPALSNGHSYLIFRVEVGPNITNSAKKPIMVLGGTIPANIPLPEFYFFKQQGRMKWKGFTHYMRGGFRAWLIPEKINGHWKLVVPDYGKRWYSEEQYEKRFILIQKIIDDRFKTPKLSPEEEFRAGINAISYSLVKRVNIINDGNRKWIHLGRPSVLSEETLYDLGTVNTDRRISFAVREVFSARISDEEKDEILSEYVFDITGDGQYVDLKRLFHGFKDDTLSHSPVDPLCTRWGMLPGEKPLTENEIEDKIIIPDNSFPPINDFQYIKDYEKTTDEVVLLEYDPSNHYGNVYSKNVEKKTDENELSSNENEYEIGNNYKYITSLNKKKIAEKTFQSSSKKIKKRKRRKREKVESFFNKK